MYINFGGWIVILTEIHGVQSAIKDQQIGTILYTGNCTTDNYDII